MNRIAFAAWTWLAGLAPVAAQTTWETDPHHPPIGISGPYTRADHGQFSADPDFVVPGGGVEFESLVNMACPASPGSYSPDEGDNNDGNGNNGGGGGG